MSGRVYFISGIDTGVGKTVVTGLMARWLRATGRDVITVKMVQTGNTGFSEDLDAHRALAGMDRLPEDDLGLTAPQIFAFPSSPELAARLEGRTVDLEKIAHAVTTCAAAALVRITLSLMCATCRGLVATGCTTARSAPASRRCAERSSAVPSAKRAVRLLACMSARAAAAIFGGKVWVWMSMIMALPSPLSQICTPIIPALPPARKKRPAFFVHSTHHDGMPFQKPNIF
jgi:hypothetical protein